MISIAKSLKRTELLLSLVKKLESAISLKDEFAVSILTTRLINMGYRLEVQND